MNHLPFIAAAYGITLVVVIVFAVDAWRRTRAAKLRLADLDTRASR
jgi:heme exporter protein CcmD